MSSFILVSRTSIVWLHTARRWRIRIQKRWRDNSHRSIRSALVAWRNRTSQRSFPSNLRNALSHIKFFSPVSFKILTEVYKIIYKTIIARIEEYWTELYMLKCCQTYGVLLVNMICLGAIAFQVLLSFPIIIH